MITLNVFDFDDTIYDGDSTLDFYIFSLKKNPTLIRYLPIQFYGFIMYILKLRKKEFFKEKFFSYIKGIKEIDKSVNEFWKKNEKKIKKWYYELNYSNKVVVSASPEFILQPICKKINIDKLIASKVNKNNGKFESNNCYGSEKVVRLNNEYSDYVIENFYSDSKSDTPLAKIAKNSYLVNKDNVEKWNVTVKE